jgi:methionyl-tRNA formyltransferase
VVTDRPLRIVFFGTPAFAVSTLEALLASRHAVAGVVTQPDKPRGRGQRTTDAPVKICAGDAGIPILQPPSLKTADFLAALAAFDADLGVVAAYGRILTDAVLATPRLGMINVHASLLPRYRGAAPVHRAVMAGDRETGVTIMRVVRALDAGPMLAAERRTIGDDETSADVERDLGLIGARLLVDCVDRLAAGPVTEVPQDAAEATYAPRLTKDDSPIDWERPASVLHNQIRGLHPWPHAQTFLDSQRLIVLRSKVMPQPAAGAVPGTIVAARGDDLDVATGAGVLRIVELQLEGKKPMRARDFLAGHHLPSGRRLSAAP